MTSQTFFQRSILPSLIAGALLAGCSDKAGPAKPPMGPMPVTVLEMQVQSVPSSIEVMAQTEGAREAEVRARVGGILMRRLYQEGDTVKAGQALFQIDRAPFEIALAEAVAGVGTDIKTRPVERHDRRRDHGGLLDAEIGSHQGCRGKQAECGGGQDVLHGGTLAMIQATNFTRLMASRTTI